MKNVNPLRRFFDMPLLLVTGPAFGFVGTSIIVALLGSYLSDQQIRQIFFCACLIPVIIGGVWDHRQLKTLYLEEVE